MKSKMFQNVVIILISFWCLTPRAFSQADARLTEVMKLNQEGKPKEALVAGRNYLKSLRGTLPDAKHPAIGYAAVVTGLAAWGAGEHEEAVRLLEEGLPIISGMVDGQLTPDIINFSLPLVASLEALKRTDDALKLLDDLVVKTRKELARGGLPNNLKLDQPGGPPVSLSAFVVNDDTLNILLERKGFMELGLKQWAQAEKDLKEAEQILKKIHPGEQQTRLVKLREGWEDAARNQGKSIRPHLVGRFSMPRAIRIEGAGVISKEEIYSALMRSSTFVIASHPSADFEEYLKKLRRCLEVGYLENGFPKATVTVDWDEAGNAVVAKVAEGPRYKWGEIRIQGAKTLTVAKLTESLILDPDAKKKPKKRADEAYEKLIATKKLNGEQMGKSVMDVFPENFMKPKNGEEAKAPSTSGLITDSNTSTKGVWEKDHWVSFLPTFMTSAKGVLRSTYASEGLFFPKFELKVVPGGDPSKMDLLVEVIEEGPTLRLGKLHVGGNQINTREELLAYVGLVEGMELKGDYLGRVKRSLYESGRFRGLEVVSRRDPKDSGKIDLLIEVMEDWEAPPLFKPLSRAQETMLKFAKWLNSEAGEASDLVIAAKIETEQGPVDLSLAMGRMAIALSANCGGGHLRMMAEQDKEAELLFLADQGPSARLFFPEVTSPISIFLELLREPTSDPFAAMGSLGAGIGIGASGYNFLRLSLDPTAALAWCASYDGQMARFENGELILESSRMVLRIDSESGRLISLTSDWQGVALEIRAEVGGIARITKDMKQMAQGTANWAEGKTPLTALYMLAAYAAELAKDESLEKTGHFNTDSLKAAAERSKRWEPLAVFLGDITTEVVDALKKINDKIYATKDNAFSIPLDQEELTAKLNAGSTMTLLLAMGTYDLFAEFIEPGTWQDLVSREILFYLDGKPFYQNQSVETLLKDDSMGPLGSLLCSRLLQQAGNPAASRFITKARAGLSDKGFAKDWSPALRGTAKEDWVGWKILNSIRKLDGHKIDGFLPENPPEIRSTAKNLVAEAAKIKPGTNADTMRPVMDSLWKNVMASTVGGMVDDMEESLTPKMDPAIVAATVNDLPVLRGAMCLMEKLKTSSMIATQFSALRAAWKPDNTEEGYREDCITTLLFARQMWTKGQSATPDAVAKVSEMIAKDLGPDGWDQIAKMGLPRKQFEWWTGALIAARAHAQQLAESEIPEKEIRDFYEKNKTLFSSSAPEVRLYTIRLTMEGDGDDTLKLAQDIRKQVDQAGTMDQKVKVFMEQAKKHSNETDTKDGGERGWVQISEEFSPAVAAEIAKVPEKSLSDVIRIELGGNVYLYLVLIPEAKRPGKAKPFEQVAPYVGYLALIDRERTLLRKSAKIKLIEQPAGKDPGKALAKPGGADSALKGIAALTDGFMPKMDAGKDKGDNKKEKLNLEVVTRKAAEGSASHIYVLGTYAERGLAPESGIPAAIQDYEKAAAGKERRAMLRLSEIYRIGRGVAPDEKKMREWAEKALAAPATPPDQEDE